MYVLRKGPNAKEKVEKYWPTIQDQLEQELAAQIKSEVSKLEQQATQIEESKDKEEGAQEK